MKKNSPPNSTSSELSEIPKDTTTTSDANQTIQSRYYKSFKNESPIKSPLPFLERKKKSFRIPHIDHIDANNDKNSKSTQSFLTACQHKLMLPQLMKAQETVTALLKESNDKLRFVDVLQKCHLQTNNAQRFVSYFDILKELRTVFLKSNSPSQTKQLFELPLDSMFTSLTLFTKLVSEDVLLPQGQSELVHLFLRVLKDHLDKTHLELKIQDLQQTQAHNGNFAREAAKELFLEQAEQDLNAEIQRCSKEVDHINVSSKLVLFSSTNPQDTKRHGEEWDDLLSKLNAMATLGIASLKMTGLNGAANQSTLGKIILLAEKNCSSLKEIILDNSLSEKDFTLLKSKLAELNVELRRDSIVIPDTIRGLYFFSQDGDKKAQEAIAPFSTLK